MAKSNKINKKTKNIIESKINDIDQEFDIPIKKEEISTKNKKETIKELDKKSNVNKNKTNRKKRNKRQKKPNKKAPLIIFSIIILVTIISVVGINMYNDYQEQKSIEEYQNNLYKDISKHYNHYIKTNKETNLYVYENEKYTKTDNLIGINQELTLEEKNITYQDEYLKVTTFEEEYYLYYKDIEPIEELSINSDRYKKYIVFNKNIVTNETTSFYDENNSLVYKFNSSFDMPIIINKKDIYGVEFNNRLLYVKQEDVKEIKDNKNTKLSNTSGIAVLNYHFFYDEKIPGEQAKCNQGICLSTENLRKHLQYIKQNEIFTPTMKELEMYIDGYLNLPKSVVLTIDDGWRADLGSNIIAENQLNATVFLMSKDYDPYAYKNDYVEIHSHGHDLHKQGVCSGGQGGAIKCLNKDKLLKDLKASQEKLFGTTVFCYPFYEYNNYSIEVLKEAGYTMAFAGYKAGGYYKVEPGINKYKLPRYVIYNYTNVNNIASYIN